MYFLIGGGVCFGEGLWLDCHEEFSWLDLPRRILSDTAVLEGIQLGFFAKHFDAPEASSPLFFFYETRLWHVACVALKSIHLLGITFQSPTEVGKCFHTTDS